MPRPGGEAAKLGSHYEAQWTVNAVLDVLAGKHTAITVEPLGDQSQGVEFYVESSDGVRQFHSVKRQKQGGDWSIAHLCHPDSASGRSILGDLFAKSACDATLQTCFVSSTGANELRELSERASKESDVSQFRRALPPELESRFAAKLVPICDSDDRRAFTRLKSLKVHLISHRLLVHTVDQQIDTLFYQLDRSRLDPGHVRRTISDYVIDHLGTRIDGDHIRDYLQSHGFGFRDWKRDPTISLTVRKTNARYRNITETELINSAHMNREVVNDIIGSLDDPHSKGALVVAPSGFGKSCVLTQCIVRLSANHTPFICLRMDSFTPCNSSRQLGEQLDLPASPAVVLAGVADNSPSVLVVDQLDSMSLVSGRRPSLWAAFNELRDEVLAYPNMKMLLACRDFDLEHDHRLRPLAQSTSGYTKHTIGKLTKSEIVDSIAASACATFTPTEKQIEILGVPFHLLLFLQGRPGPTFASVAQLYNAYSKRKRRNLRERLDRPPQWSRVIDALTQRMNADQLLFAPKIVVDPWSDDAEAMVSEHVLVDMDDQNQYRFFHESFFDYAYARRFADTDRRVLDLLRTTEQHLFRRSQVRQILDFRREHDFAGYIADVVDILDSADVRFHIKRMVASAFARLDKPRHEEWKLIEPRLFHGPLSLHLWGALYSHSGWFDLLNRSGTLRHWLASNDSGSVDAAIRYLEPPDLQEVRSARIAALIRPYAESGRAWHARIIRIMSWHKIHKSTDMRSLNIDLIARGSYDDYSETSTGRGFWNQYYGADEECPTFVIDVIKTWFDRSVEQADDGVTWSFFDRVHYDRSDIGTRLVQQSALARPDYYVQQMLPSVTATIIKTQHHADDEVLNRTWRSISNVGNPYSVREAILLSLRKALQHLAIHDVDLFRRHITPLLPHPHTTFAYLLVRSWQAHPDEFADECVRYLVADRRRLNVGYVGNGNAIGPCAVSRGAIRAASPLCSNALFAELESTIMHLPVDWELHSPKHRGYTELLLLRELHESRTSESTNARIRELTRKFPDLSDALPEEDVTLEAEMIGPPIPRERAGYMTDDQWISAMRTYQSAAFSLEGGAHELSQLLTELARSDRHRFASLAMRMPVDINPVYLSAILDGLSGRFVNDDKERADDKDVMRSVRTDLFLGVIDRAHALPGKPCGTSIVHCVRILSDRDLPLRALSAVSYYAMYDPDPNEEIWRRDNWRDPYAHGINCVRGQAAEAIGALLVDDQTRLAVLRPALDSLSQDPIISVRTCAIVAFLPLLKYSRDLAVRLFVTTCDGRAEMWSTHPFERFVHFSIYTHYGQLRPILQSALFSNDSKSAGIVARLITFAELDDVDVGSDGKRVGAGSVAMRRAAVGVYARNVSKEVVGPVCMSRLEGFFDDEDEEVRSEAAKSFSHVSDEWLVRSRDFILRFVESTAFEAGPYHLLHAIAESNLAVPDVICRAAERVLEFLGEEGTHVAYNGSMIAQIIATLVVRQYQQTAEASIETRCLDLIDRMEQSGYFGIDTELARLER